jgi:hypothetical protein
MLVKDHFSILRTAKIRREAEKRRSFVTVWGTSLESGTFLILFAVLLHTWKSNNEIQQPFTTNVYSTVLQIWSCFMRMKQRSNETSSSLQHCIAVADLELLQVEYRSNENSSSLQHCVLYCCCRPRAVAGGVPQQ